MSSCGIYIPTHRRAFAVIKTLRETIAASKGKAPVYLVMDYDQIEDYKEKIPSYLYPYFEIFPLTPLRRRISFAMCQIMEHAEKKGFKYVIRVDDDKIPPMNLLELLDSFKRHPELGWVGGYFGFYGLLKIQPNSGTYYSARMACNIFAVDVAKMKEAGGFDQNMIILEDADAKVKLMKAGYYTAINSNVECKSLNNRGAPGGISSFSPAPEIEMTDYFNKVHGGPGFQPASLRKGRAFIKLAWMAKRGLFKNIDYSKMASQGGKALDY